MASVKFAVALAALLALAGCDDVPSNADQQQRTQQAQLSEQSNAQVGMPGITKFTEKRMMKKIMELRDQAVLTHTYTMDMQGRLWHVCESIGYGLPYSAQYTNPERPLGYHETSMQGNATIPQADPNGLFMPGSAEGTWVACAAKATDDFQVVYLEPRIIVSPFKLHAEGEYQEK